MTKETFKYKNKIPKSLSGRKKSKTIEKKNTLSLPKKIPLQINKKGKQLLGRSGSKWKLPTLLFISCMLVMVLIIPSMIVLPFIGDEKGNSSQVEAEKIASMEETVSPFSVNVYRSTFDEVEEIPLEDYVVGVVASEMPMKFEEEALKAQALAARTYIVNYMMNQETDEDYDVTDTVEHQVYQSNEELKQAWGSDYASNIEKLKAAVKATEGEIITSEEEPITPAFFSTSNGYTENSEDYWEEEMPYLRSVESTWDEDSPEFLDQKVLSVHEAEQALGVQLPVGEHLQMEVSRTDSNRVSTLSLGDNDFSGREVREKLELKSSDFSVEQNNDHLVFTTKGYGHGIGMSQYGANGMAEEGKTYEDIVDYYYQDIELNKVDEVAEVLIAE